MKKKKNKEKDKEKARYAKFCPKCKSMYVEIDYRGGWVAWGIPPIYVCRDCGFTSYVFPEVRIEKKGKKEEKETKEESKEKK